MPRLICYCFEHTGEEIRREVLDNNGRSLILEKILAEKKAGTCRCSELHPEGR
ncbi:MAG: (2Fe-2S)-binding protein [Geothermobacteraceae bacterium]